MFTWFRGEAPLRNEPVYDIGDSWLQRRSQMTYNKITGAA